MKKKTKKRKGRDAAEQLRKAGVKAAYWAAQKKNNITPEYLRAMITELTRLIAEKT